MFLANKSFEESLSHTMQTSVEGFVFLTERHKVLILKKAGLYKAEIRDLSAMLGLPTWDKLSFACLASRFVYGETITRDRLKMVERAEDLLADLGFGQRRVRVHGDLARIEVTPADFERILRQEVREEIVRRLKDYGFSYVSLDLAGYRTGSMNEVLPEAGKSGQA